MPECACTPASCDNPGTQGCYFGEAKQLAKQGETKVPRTFVPAATRVMAEVEATLRTTAREVARRMEAHLSGMQVILSRHLEQPVVGMDAASPLAGILMLPQHSLEAEAAMSTELVACTLSGRHRPELLPDLFSGGAR